jgi:hypothetical protein
LSSYESFSLVVTLHVQNSCSIGFCNCK